MRSAAAAVLALAAVAPAVAGARTAAVDTSRGAAAEAGPILPTYQLDRKGDVRGPLDIVRVAMSRRLDGTWRGELTMRRAWDAADAGAGASLCLKLYVKAQPDADPPEYLVCTAPRAGAQPPAGSVLRNSATGLPHVVGPAVVSRPTRRTIYFSFDPALIRRPTRILFAGESVWRGPRCPRATGCLDLAPDAPGAREFRLRSGG